MDRAVAAFRGRLRFHNYDVCVRYYPVVRFIRRRDPGRRWKILDVGCGAAGIAPYLRGWRVQGIDPEIAVSASGRFPVLAGSASALPFADSSCDVSTCVDVLEHIEPRLRATVLQELIRVSRQWVLVAFPCGQEAQQADLSAERAYRAAGLDLPAWLSEHLRHPLPDVVEIEKTLSSTRGGNRITGQWTHYNESLALQRIHRHLARQFPSGYKLFSVTCSLALPLLARLRPSRGSYRCLMVLRLSPSVFGVNDSASDGRD